MAVIMAFVNQHRWAPAGGISVHVTAIAAPAAAIYRRLLSAAVHPKAGAGRFSLLAQHQHSIGEEPAIVRLPEVCMPWAQKLCVAMVRVGQRGRQSALLLHTSCASFLYLGLQLPTMSCSLDMHAPCRP